MLYVLYYLPKYSSIAFIMLERAFVVNLSNLPMSTSRTCVLRVSIWYNNSFNCLTIRETFICSFRTCSQSCWFWYCKDLNCSYQQLWKYKICKTDMLTFLILFLCRFNKFTWCGMATLKLLIWISRRLIGCLIVRLSDKADMFPMILMFLLIVQLFCIIFSFFISLFDKHNHKVHSSGPSFFFSVFTGGIFHDKKCWSVMTYGNNLITAFYYLTPNRLPCSAQNKRSAVDCFTRAQKLSEKKIARSPHL